MTDTITDYRTEPFKSILAEGTVADYKTVVADTGQTGIKPAFPVYLTRSAAANAVTLVSAAHGDAIKTEADIFIPEIPETNPAFAKMYEKDTAFPAIGTKGSSFRAHKLKKGDKIWCKTAGSFSCNESDRIICAGTGLWAKLAGTTTPDVYNVHYVTPIHVYTNTTWFIGEYQGVGVFDNSA